MKKIEIKIPKKRKKTKAEIEEAIKKLASLSKSVGHPVNSVDLLRKYSGRG